MYRTHTCGELNIDNTGQDVILSGWVQKSRDLGGMTFVDLRDRYGLTQLVFDMETNNFLCEKARKLGREFVIQAKGRIKERSNKNLEQKLSAKSDAITALLAELAKKSEQIERNNVHTQRCFQICNLSGQVGVMSCRCSTDHC